MKLKHIVCSLAGVLLLHSFHAHALDEGKTKTYDIKKGKYYSTFATSIFRENRLDLEVTFNDSAEYHLPGEYMQVNKLFGFTDCSSTIHQNSARFGWRWRDGRIQIMAYSYANGVRNYVEDSLGYIDPNLSYKMSIEIRDDVYRFILHADGERYEEEHPRGCSNSNAIKTLSYFYFGGQYPAPHDMSVQIKRLKAESMFTSQPPYPNPTNGDVTIPLDIKEDDKELYVKVYDMLGREIMRVPEKGFLFYKAESTYELKLDLNRFASAMYMVCVSDKYDLERDCLKVIRK